MAPRTSVHTSDSTPKNLTLILSLTGGVVAILVVIGLAYAIRRRRSISAESQKPATETTPLSSFPGLFLAKEGFTSSQDSVDTSNLSQVEAAELRDFYPMRRLSTPTVLNRPKSPRGYHPEDFLKRRFSVIPEGTDVEDLPKFSNILRERFSIFDGNLDPTLYSSDEDLVLHALNSYGTGKLCFSVAYNSKHKILFVTIHKATYLSSKTAKESGNFYVKVGLIPSENRPQRSATISTIRNPIFEQSFSFHIEPEDVDSKRIEFTVKEATRMEKNITIGHVWFKLNEAQLTSNDESLQAIWRDIIGGDLSPAENAGDVELSLSYNPTNGNLVVGVLNARNLAVRDQDVSIYARVSVMSGERAIKTKKSKSIKQNLRHPFFDQRMVFSIDKALASSVYLQCHVCSRGRFGLAHLIGKCCLGSVNYAEGEGLSHWMAMMKEPCSTIHQWHRLI